MSINEVKIKQPALVEARSVEANGQSFHLLESGKNNQQLVIFLHGFPEYSGMWVDYLKEIGLHSHAVAPDQRGYNLSSKPANVDDYEIHFLVEDIKSLVSALGHKQAHLVAHDWGGFIAWHAISKYPEIFTKAVIMNGPHPQVYSKLYISDPDQIKKSEYVQLLKLPGSEHILAANDYAFFRKGMFDVSKRPFAEDEKNAYKEAWNRGLKYPIYYYKANFKDMETEFTHAAHTDVPTLLIWGEQDDHLSIKNLDGLEEWVRHLTIKRYPDATHWVQHEKREDILRDIRTFFGGREIGGKQP